MYTNLLLVLLVTSQTWAAPNKISDYDMHPHLPPVPIRFSDVDPAEGTPDYWIENAQKTVQEKISRQLNQNVAKNVIIFMGDGMSIPTITAARVYLGGEEAQLSFDKFPYTALSKTYDVDRQVADSASTATAYLCGVKTNYGTIGIGPQLSRYDCQGMANSSNHVHSIAYYSQLQNKKTGIVTTSRVTHASPGGAYAHTSNRDWESDTDILNSEEDPQVCMDIATQLLVGDTGKNLNVIMGGGRAKFLPMDVEDDEGHMGERSDGVNVIETWLSQKENAQYVWNRDQLLALDDADNLLGLFSEDHMDYNLDRNTTLDPSLAEMTEAAIKILSKGENGYFLFVEGGRIDSGHHAAEARIALDETIEFSKAVQAAVDLTDEADTLIVVTADHAHTMSYSGYATRHNDIFGYGGIGDDEKVYSTLTYANGPGFRLNDFDGSRHDLTQDDHEDPHYKYPETAPRHSESHGGDDVAVFARGPWAHLFTGNMEQNVIPHLMSYASCVGEGLKACEDSKKKNV